ADVTYDGAAHGAGATVAGVNGTAAGTLEGVGLTFTYYAGTDASGPALSGAPSAAGTYTVVASFAGSADYTSASAQATFTIARAPLPVTAASASKVYGAANPTFTYTLSGFAGSDNAGVVSGSADLETLATAASGVGAYPITATLGSLA